MPSQETPPSQPKQENPLFTQLLSPLSGPERLAEIRTSLSQGADPNELDNLGRHSIGRPLHYALSTDAGYSLLAQNLPIIKVLLEAGADPRMRGESVKGIEEFGRCALDEVSALLRGVDENGSVEDRKALRVFYEGALKEMTQVAEELDAKENAKNDAKSDENEKGFSWFRRQIDFWF